MSDSTSSVGNSILSSLISSYEAYDAEDTSTTSEGTYDLGTEDFLTLLLAQLENQNPLDPADTDDFTDQLAQFTQVEQLINVNDKLDEMTEELEASEDDIDANSYVGLTVVDLNFMLFSVEPIILTENVSKCTLCYQKRLKSTRLFT